MALLTVASLVLLSLVTVCTCKATILTVTIAPSYDFIPWQNDDANFLASVLNTSNTTYVISNDADNRAETNVIILESDLLDFYNTVYSKSEALLVFVDLRHDACPIDLFRQRLLGYVRMSLNHCPTLNEIVAGAVMNLETWSFDLMMFMTQFMVSWTLPSSKVEHLHSSFAVFFDKSGEDHFLLPNRQVTRKLMFEITLPLTNCSDPNHVTQLAAQTNIKDVIVIATTSCVYSLMLAASRLHIPPTRFRWLLYPTDYNDTFKWNKLYRFFDRVSPIILTEKERSLNRPVYSHTKLLRFVNHATTTFQSSVQSEKTSSDCLLDCILNCSACQTLFRKKLMEIPGQMYEVFSHHSQSERRGILFDLNRITSKGNDYLGTWSQETGLILNQAAYPPSFVDSQLSVVVVVEPPFIFRNTTDNGGVGYYGYSIDVLKEISQRVGFSYTLSECDSGGYGVLEKGKWTGCIGNVVRGEADIILGALTVTAERNEVIDFTLPYYNFAGIQILMKKQTVNINLFYYANVFTTQAWMSLAAVVVATSILLWGFEKVTSSKTRKSLCSVKSPVSCINSFPPFNNAICKGVSKIAFSKNTKDDKGKVDFASGGIQTNVPTINLTTSDILKKKEDLDMVPDKRTEEALTHSHTLCTLGDSFWYVIGSLTMTGGGDPPKSFSGRMLIAGFWFFAVIMMSTFTANLAAFLTVSRMGMTITSLGDLARQKVVKYAVVNQSSVMEYFQRMAQIEKDFYERWKAISLDRSTGDTQDSLAVWDYPLGNTYHAIWKNLQDSGLIKSNELGLERVLSENFALITESPLIQYYTGKNCDLMGVGEQFSIRPYAIGLKDRSPYTNKFSDTILELQKERELGSIRLRWWTSSEMNCPKEIGSSGLDLYSLSGTFIIAGAGVASGFLIFGLEHLISRVKKRRR